MCFLAVLVVFLDLLGIGVGDADLKYCFAFGLDMIAVYGHTSTTMVLCVDNLQYISTDQLIIAIHCHQYLSLPAMLSYCLIEIGHMILSLTIFD